MKTYKYILIFVFALVTGCNFLDQPVKDALTDESFWSSEEQARSYFFSFF